MNYLNLNTLKIEKEYNYRETEIDLSFAAEQPLGVLMKTAEEQIKTSIVETDLPINYSFVIETECIDDDTFTTLVNVITAALVKVQNQGTPRKRERRLDVPEKIKQYCYASVSALKTLVNNVCRNDCLMFTIDAGEYHFDFVNQDLKISEMIVEKGVIKNDYDFEVTSDE